MPGSITRREPRTYVYVLGCLLGAMSILIWGIRNYQQRRFSGMLEKTWQAYKHSFISPAGQVRRLEPMDTVSEGQAYAMLRAAWMRDKETFDRCYRWSEINLSRRGKGDALLAWHWADGKVSDWMPASDAEIDYAVSLIFADSLWPGGAPAGLVPYGERARQEAADILRRLTFSTRSGRLYLAPWFLRSSSRLNPQNPSYYSPAQFRILHRFTGDRRWLGLVDTTYFLLDKLSRGFGGTSGVGLIPDWCDVDDDDAVHPRPKESEAFGWNAVRVPFRIGWDYFWFQSVDARKFFDSGMAKFISEEWARRRTVFCGYQMNGQPVTRSENPAFYAAYYYALAAVGSADAPAVLEKNRSYLVHNEEGWFYGGPDYYVNSLAWLAEGLRSGVVRDLSSK